MLTVTSFTHALLWYKSMHSEQFEAKSKRMFAIKVFVLFALAFGKTYGQYPFMNTSLPIEDRVKVR